MSLEKQSTAAVERRAQPRPMTPLGGGADPTPNPLLLFSNEDDLNTPTMTPTPAPIEIWTAATASSPSTGETAAAAAPAYLSGFDDPEPAHSHSHPTTVKEENPSSASTATNSTAMEVLFSQDIPVVFEEVSPMDLLWDLQDPAGELQQPVAIPLAPAAGTIPITTGAVTLEASSVPECPQPMIVAPLPSPGLTFATNPMACFNPLDVEGKFMENLMVHQEAAPPAAKRNKKDLKLIMPEPLQQTTAQPEASSLIDTPAIESVLGKQAEEADFDLLAFVTNQTLPVNDPSFLALIEDVNASSPSEPAPLSTIDESALCRPSSSKAPPKGKRIMTKKEVVVEEAPVEKAPTKPKRRGRPPTATSTLTASSIQDHLSYATTSRKSKVQAAAAEIVSGEEEVEDKKYRRMRDLNNAASKRCRQNRKRKFDDLLGSEEQLTARNKELKIKCKHMEGLVRQLKAKFIEKVANPKRQPLDLDQLMAQRLSAM